MPASLTDPAKEMVPTKKHIESVSMLIPLLDPTPPPIVSTLGYFFPAMFLDYCGCLVPC